MKMLNFRLYVRELIYNWDFSKELVNDYLKAVADTSKYVDLV